MSSDHPKTGTATVLNLVHEGGSDPKEKNHLKVGLYNAQGNPIPSKWSLDEMKTDPKTKTKGLYHVYPHDHPSIKQPSSFADAAEKSLELKRAAEAAAAAKLAKEKEEKAKLIAKQKEEGQKKDRIQIAAESKARMEETKAKMEVKKGKKALSRGSS
ncbi:hypothetical protein BDQ12DRAFT_715742 [Crucibulum laeve]|uniref:Uncharacterized protein n=1 Tax=Crucibulum laeve TaxID=68775 RepID=A0A5C3LNU2_9AGAR|nr:hypothetical protein BDQ12DRAFT_715742 [Crucibulum laeve]